MKHRKTFIPKKQIKEDLKVALASISYLHRAYQKQMDNLRRDHLALGIVAVVGYLLLSVCVVL